MRSRTGNFFHEAHGKTLRHYDFIADGSKGPDAVLAAVESATGLRWQGHSLGQHGFINTSRRPDGSLYVALVMYEDCDGSCGLGHPPHVRAADLAPNAQADVKKAVGEHPAHKLGAGKDVAVLTSLGMGPDTHPHLHDEVAHGL